jgi:prefoldin subunit 1
LKHWNLAANDAKECIRLDPTFVKGYYRLAAAQVELQDHDGAMATIRQGLAIDANNPQLTKQLRIVQQQKKVALAKSTQLTTASPPALAGQVDAATALELQSLRSQYEQTSRECQAVQASVFKSQREHKMAQLTSQELDQLPDTSNCYRSIGKIFLRSSKGEMVDLLVSRMESEKRNEADMMRKKEYLERQSVSLRQNIEELLTTASGSVSASAE